MDKIKAFLVDDEYLERTLIKYSVPWDEIGFEIIGEANSGEEMIKQIESNKPDVIFTDVCMPFMDGLQMSKKIKEMFEDIEIIIITGHREFLYAKTAIGLGAFDYILKPIDKNELKDVSLKVKKHIEKKRKYINNNQNAANKVQKYSELVEKAIEIINNYLSDSTLSLKTIAEKLYVNPSYLCRLFKKETNKNITDYITGLRIERSLEYLNSTNLKAYEIAEKVGISDSHYFSICFKKYTGKSIQKYKKECMSA